MKREGKVMNILEGHELNKRIAEVLGIYVRKIDDHSYVCMKLNAGPIKVYLTEEEAWRDVPDYANDLNAIHELVRGLNEEEAWEYQSNLYHNLFGHHLTVDFEQLDAMDMILFMEATASEKARAWLMVKEGK